jgi:hypothetical protein
MDSRQHLSYALSTDQCIACVCDQLYPPMAVFHVAAIPKGNLHKGLTFEIQLRGSSTYGFGYVVLRMPIYCHPSYNYRRSSRVFI